MNSNQMHMPPLDYLIRLLSLVIGTAAYVSVAPAAADDHLCDVDNRLDLEAEVADRLGTDLAWHDDLLLIGGTGLNGPGSSGGARLYDYSDPEHPVHLSTMFTPGTDGTSSSGSDVALNGNYAVIGAPTFSDGAITNQGRAFLFDVRDPKNPIYLQYLEADTPNGNDRFSDEIIINDDNVLVISNVGANDDKTGFESGEVYIYDINEGNAVFRQKLLRIPEGIGGSFGRALCWMEQYLLVTTEIQSRKPGANGALYVFEENDSGVYQLLTIIWGEQFGGDGWNLFGLDVTSHRTRLAIRVAQAPSIFEDMVYILELSDPFNPVLLASIYQDDLGKIYPHFGAAMDLNDDYLIIGAPSADFNGEASGSIYFYRLDPDGTPHWYQRIHNPIFEVFAQFGRTIHVQGPTVSISAAISSIDIETGGAVYLNECPLPGCRADLDDNDTVDVRDLLVLLKNFGQREEGRMLQHPVVAVDLLDVMYLLDSWGTCE